jgi:hypothetical protein
MVTLIRVNENKPQATKFATQNNIYVSKWYKTKYNDGNNYYFDDGDVLQDIPMNFVETRQATTTEANQLNNNKLLFG